VINVEFNPTLQSDLAPDLLERAALPCSRPTHSLSRVVLPKPACAETSVSARSSPVSNSSIKRGRETNSGRMGGTWSFVFNSAMVIFQDLRASSRCLWYTVP